MNQPLLLQDYDPHSELVVPTHSVAQARFAAIDAHNHLPVTDARVGALDWGQMVAMMDAVNLRSVVNLSGGWGENLRANLETLDRRYPGRFYSFCNVDFQRVAGPGWLERRSSEASANGITRKTDDTLAPLGVMATTTRPVAPEPETPSS